MTGETRTVYSVSQVTDYLKTTLDSDPNVSDLWIRAEVSSAHTAGSGHSYFTLLDGESALSCVMFRGGRGDEFLANGEQVLAHGRISIYKQRGDLQFYVDLIKPEGVGALQIAFEKMRQSLEEEGLFDPGRKRRLPRFPQRIGVVTSPDGAVLQDILNVLSRRYPLAELVLAPTAVQGDSAAPLIADAIGAVNRERDIDVLIVARGGGSLEDLWAFNEEVVARAIFASRVPVVSAVGHETDTTIADLVADVRAPTPSAAAEIIVPDRRELLETVSDYATFMIDGVIQGVEDRKRSVSLSADRLAARAPDTRTPRVRIDELLRVASAEIRSRLEVYQERTRGLENELRALGPSEILERGYAIVRSASDGGIISSPSQTRAGDRLDIAVSGGTIAAETVELRSNDG
ncbi:MAG: exodeoxyribonuclease VII large subunit [Chloroflexi bacterium]|nr:exodeoxyribonuclease VII large subunit [Chloroflexota bacterium]